MGATSRADRFTRRALLSAAGAGVLAGCAGGRDPDGLRFWATSYEGDYSPLLMPDFTRATGIAVEVQSVPSTAAHEKYLTAFAGGVLPDVFMLPAHWVGEFATVGAIAPIPDAAIVADVLPAVMGMVRRGGRDHAVPWSAAPQAQFYRRDLLAEAGYATPPESWDAWRRMGHALKRRRPDEFPFLILLNWPDTLATLILQAVAVPLRDRNTRGNFRTPEMREAFAFYRALFDEGLAPRALSTEVQDPFAAFAQGRFAIWPSWPSLLRDFARREGEIAPALWGTARLPGPSGPGTASMYASSLAVSAATRRPDAAWALVRHLTSRASELRFQTMIGNLPANRTAWSSPQLTLPVLAPFAAQLRVPPRLPPVIEWERIQGEAQVAAERMVRGLQTVDEALASIDARVDRILAKRRSLVERGVLP